MTGGGETLGILLSHIHHSGFRGESLLPERQQGIQSVFGWQEVLAKLRVHQVLEQGRHPQTTAAGPAAGHRVGGAHRLRPQPCGAVAASPQGFAPGQGTGGHKGQAGGQFLKPTTILLSVQQRHPAGAMGIALSSAQLHLRNPSSSGHKAQSPALQVTPPAQLIGKIRMRTGQGKAGQPFRGGGGLHRQALHLPGPPFSQLRDWFSGLHRQPCPDRFVLVRFRWLAAAFARFHGAAWKREAGRGIDAAGRQQIFFVQPGFEVFGGEGEWMQCGS